MSSLLRHAERIKEYATKRMCGKDTQELDIDTLAAATTALQIWDRLLKRTTDLLYKAERTPQEQIEYALDDVRHLFALKDSLLKEMEEKLPLSKRKQVLYSMKHCAEQKNPERPGWEKICNFKLLNAKEKVYIKHFFLARDGLARRADVPASRILAKQDIVAMAKAGTWEGILSGGGLRHSGVFEKARLAAEREISGKKN